MYCDAGAQLHPKHVYRHIRMQSAGWWFTWWCYALFHLYDITSYMCIWILYCTGCTGHIRKFHGCNVRMIYLGTPKKYTTHAWCDMGHGYPYHAILNPMYHHGFSIYIYHGVTIFFYTMVVHHTQYGMVWVSVTHTTPCMCMMYHHGVKKIVTPW